MEPKKAKPEVMTSTAIIQCSCGNHVHISFGQDRKGWETCITCATRLSVYLEIIETTDGNMVKQIEITREIERLTNELQKLKKAYPNYG